MTSRSGSVYGLSSPCIVTRSPTAIVARLTRSLFQRPPVTILPPRTPIEPVRVPGRATIQAPGVATSYPPEPATGHITTTSGLREATVSSARRIASDAVEEPPRELT